ncbi:MAG: hypothetical protein ACD_36C00116G0006 [uncultured bacterium]|uniref:Uncharacterized protein n=1 Tax=Candidatus Gottesmanbacteria bacterium RIFCSPLOWO2_01_FULL_43_11b TaxID=1798392 RepID=A0A1F6AGA3_9BACT|nr:MAG: hypothetical protein ACD_36C00116G0006 [uncultured bacterium]OGG23779.1 MAG: hypothetical protein A3A79_01050 [Candidatus Gottesmanbacteria bacterium RIFCSPLOWO2_01_FULL_43_11b]
MTRQVGGQQGDGGQTIFPRPQDLGYGNGVAYLIQKDDGSGYDILYIDPKIAEDYNRQFMERLGKGGKREVQY